MRPRRILWVIIVTGLLIGAISLMLSGHGSSAVKKSRNEYLIALSTPMQRTLHRYDRSFVTWSSSDYLPSITKTYPFSARQAPFAVIGDMNGDGNNDAVLMGHTAMHDVMVCLLSTGKQYRAIAIEEWPLTDPKTEWYGMGAYKEYGLWNYLTHIPPGKISSPHEKDVLELKTEAFQLNAYEKASVIYYYKAGGFHQYITGD